MAIIIVPFAIGILSGILGVYAFIRIGLRGETLGRIEGFIAAAASLAFSAVIALMALTHDYRGLLPYLVVTYIVLIYYALKAFNRRFQIEMERRGLSWPRKLGPLICIGRQKAYDESANDRRDAQSDDGSNSA